MAAANGAAFDVSGYGCGINYAYLNATAEGLVDGKRRIIRLKVARWASAPEPCNGKLSEPPNGCAAAPVGVRITRR